MRTNLVGLEMAERPYPVPSARTFGEWCIALGLRSERTPDDTRSVLSFDDFCSLPDIDLRKVGDGELYGFWRKYGDVWGECRTVSEWLSDFDWKLAFPEEDGGSDELHRFLGHDEFWNWASGRVEFTSKPLWKSFWDWLGKNVPLRLGQADRKL